VCNKYFWVIIVLVTVFYSWITYQYILNRTWSLVNVVWFRVPVNFETTHFFDWSLVAFKNSWYIVCLLYVPSGSWVRNADLNWWGEKNIDHWRISSADEMAAQQTGWKESEESSAENQEQGWCCFILYIVVLWIWLQCSDTVRWVTGRVPSL